MTPELFTAADYLTVVELETGAAAERVLEIVPRDRLLMALFAPYAGPGGMLREEPRPLSDLAASLAASLAGEGLLARDRALAGASSDVAVTAMVGFLAKNGRSLETARGHRAREHARAVELVERVVAGEATESALAAWVAERIV